jgi:hypothetical protein
MSDSLFAWRAPSGPGGGSTPSPPMESDVYMLGEGGSGSIDRMINVTVVETLCTKSKPVSAS